jgi:hypothetical protein
MELTIVGASTLLTESRAVLLCRNVALPTKIKPLFMSVLRSGGGRSQARELNYAPCRSIPAYAACAIRRGFALVLRGMAANAQ